MNKNLVTSLELSKRLDKLLKEKGIEVETLFCWCSNVGKDFMLIARDKKSTYPNLFNHTIPAFLSGELGELLPSWLIAKGEVCYLEILKLEEGGWEVSYSPPAERCYGGLETAKTEAEARGLMYEYLLKNNLIKC